MQIEGKNLDSINITVTFNVLDKDHIRRDIIKDTFKDEEIQIAEVKNVLFIIFNDRNVRAHFANKRLAVSIAMFDDLETASDSCAYVVGGLLAAINKDDISAYGFNFQGNFRSSDVDYNKYLLKVCYNDGVGISQNIGVPIIHVAPGFCFNMHEAQFFISLDPDTEEFYLDFHCNVQFSEVIPPTDQVKQQIKTYLGYFYEIMESL